MDKPALATVPSTRLDAVSAWGELMRFADASGVELDERAEPGYEAPKEPTDESDVSDYSVVLKAIQTGYISISSTSVLTIHWRRPLNESDAFKLDPNTWPYGRALRAMETAPVSKAAQERQGEEGGIAKLHRFIETLGGKPLGALNDLGHKSDCMIVLRVGNIIASE